jgi:hypothetical protein
VRAIERRVEGRLSHADVALDVLDDDDGVVHHEADREHDREQRQQVQREAEHLDEEDHADQRQGNGDDGHEHGPERSEEEEDDDHDDADGLEERPRHVVDGAVDVPGRVVRDGGLHPRRQVAPDGIHLAPDAPDDVERVGVGQDPHAHEDGLAAGEPDVRVVVVGAEGDVRDVLETDERPVVLAEDELLEVRDRGEVRGGGQVDLDELALGLADGGEVVVRGERGADLRRADVERRHAIGPEPRAQREGSAAEDVRALHPLDRGEAWLDDPDQVVGDLVALEDGRAERQVHRRGR